MYVIEFVWIYHSLDGNGNDKFLQESQEITEEECAKESFLLYWTSSGSGFFSASYQSNVTETCKKFYFLFNLWRRIPLLIWICDVASSTQLTSKVNLLFLLSTTIHLTTFYRFQVTTSTWHPNFTYLDQTSRKFSNCFSCDF